MFNISHATYDLCYGERNTVGIDVQTLGTVKQCREEITMWKENQADSWRKTQRQGRTQDLKVNVKTFNVGALKIITRKENDLDDQILETIYGHHQGQEEVSNNRWRKPTAVNQK